MLAFLRTIALPSLLITKWWCISQPDLPFSKMFPTWIPASHITFIPPLLNVIYNFKIGWDVRDVFKIWGVVRGVETHARFACFVD